MLVLYAVLVLYSKLLFSKRFVILANFNSRFDQFSIYSSALPEYDTETNLGEPKSASKI